MDYFKRKVVDPAHVLGDFIGKLEGKGNPDYPVSDKRGSKPFRKSYASMFKEFGKSVILDTTCNLDQFKTVLLSWILSMSRYSLCFPPTNTHIQ